MGQPPAGGRRGTGRVLKATRRAPILGPDTLPLRPRESLDCACAVQPETACTPLRGFVGRSRLLSHPTVRDKNKPKRLLSLHGYHCAPSWRQPSCGPPMSARIVVWGKPLCMHRDEDFGGDARTLGTQEKRAFERQCHFQGLAPPFWDQGAGATPLSSRIFRTETFSMFCSCVATRLFGNTRQTAFLSNYFIRHYRHKAAHHAKLSSDAATSRPRTTPKEIAMAQRYAVVSRCPVKPVFANRW